MLTSQEFFTNRNAEIIRQYLQLREEGKKWREIVVILADAWELSKGLIHRVVWDKSYSYASEAWEIVKNEQKTEGVKVNLS